MRSILDLQKLTPVAIGTMDGDEMLMSTASGLCPTGHAEDSSPFNIE